LSASSPNAPSRNEVDRLVRDAVHEFRTPLTVIREFASILAEGLCEPGVVSSEECAEAILGASGDLLDMIESFRAIAGVEGSIPDRRSCTTATVWEEVRPALVRRAEERGVRLEAEFDAGAAALDVDPKEVARALRGLVRSAIRSTPAGGRIRCWARRRNCASVAIGCLVEAPAVSDGDLLLFDLGEIGEGIERRSRICTFGLDLELSRVVAAANGGRLRLRRGPGGGRAWILSLPSAPAVAAGEGRRHVASAGTMP
jgi:K+-sensing histidine kinase KdpD